MAYKAAGKIEKIFDTEQKSQTFQVRQFVIEVTEGKYPEMVSFQLTQDSCGLIDDYSEGDQVEVDFDLRGREWNGKYFTNLNAWRITRTGDESGSNADGFELNAPPGQSAPSAKAAEAVDDFDDDIPF